MEKNWNAILIIEKLMAWYKSVDDPDQAYQIFNECFQDIMRITKLQEKTESKFWRQTLNSLSKKVQKAQNMTKKLKQASEVLCDRQANLEVQRIVDGLQLELILRQCDEPEGLEFLEVS